CLGAVRSRRPVPARPPGRHPSRCRLMWRFLIVLAAAAPPGPYQDQPGRLSPQQIDAARSAAKAADPEAVTLLSSGRLGNNQPYAVLATAPQRVSDRLTTRRNILCAGAGEWRCQFWYVEATIAAAGRTHVLPVERGFEQIAGDVVDYMYSPCFGSQFEKLKGRQPAFSRETADLQVVRGDFYVTTVKSNIVYMVRKADPADGGCAFVLFGINDPALARPIDRQARDAGSRIPLSPALVAVMMWASL